VFSLFKVGTNTEAVQLANDNVYGLSAAVFSKDLGKAEMKARQLDAGSVFINDYEQSDPGIPGGGVKDSGYGREGYRDGMHEICNRKAIVYGKL
jgi:acyl-CoA reductase-like NAD-dependent aldehyde dehydrogenase